MTVGLIDVIDWQTTIDFSDGRPIECEHPLVELAADLLPRYRYPGDLTSDADAWVTDMALLLNARYQPNFIFLDYAHPFITAMFRDQTEAEHNANVAATFAQIARFLEATDFTPVIVGLGDLCPMVDYIDITGFESLVSAGGMATRYAGLYNPSARDLSALDDLEGLARVVDREAFCSEFGGVPEHYQRFPDYLLASKEGYIFRGVGTIPRPLYSLPKYERHLPLHTSLGDAAGITDIPDLVLRGLTHEKVALILVEGVGCETFPLSYSPLDNTCNWHCYTVGDFQYLALTTGQHFTERPYHLAYRYFVDDVEDKPYPFSGVYTTLPADTIGRRYAGKSAAVGNRGMFTNLAAGVDIAIECFVRALYNHGAMAVLDI